MKILVTADLHYDVARSRAPVRRLARRACAEGGDAIVLVGDTAGANLKPLSEALELFGGFGGRKWLVVGNHCLWCRDGEDSLDRYQKILPELARAHGFEVLDHGPCMMGDVGLVGSVGWYDYSFADESLGIPEAFYRAKIAPGAAAYLGGYDELLSANHSNLTDRHLAIGSRWMDGRHVRLPVDDKVFCQTICHKLSRQLSETSGKARRILAFVHHLPFRQLVPAGRPDRFAFAAAFLGAKRLGDVLLECPKVSHVYCGHSHWPMEQKIEHLSAINVGSTYSDKRLEILEL